MKAMILVLSSKECMNLLNGDLSVLARKKFPKDYVGWVYIYCMKARPYLVRGNGLVDNLIKEHDKNYIPEPKKFEIYNFEDDGYSAEFYDFFNGKVVARFWCDKVEEIEHSYSHFYFSEEESKKMLYEGLIERLGCISADELHLYLKGKNGKAIHITNLEIFDKPKEIKEFYKVGYEKCVEPQGSLREQVIENYNNALKYQLTCAPRSGWCYVEV